MHLLNRYQVFFAKIQYLASKLSRTRNLVFSEYNLFEKSVNDSIIQEKVHKLQLQPRKSGKTSLFYGMPLGYFYSSLLNASRDHDYPF